MKIKLLLISCIFILFLFNVFFRISVMGQIYSPPGPYNGYGTYYIPYNLLGYGSNFPPFSQMWHLEPVLFIPGRGYIYYIGPSEPEEYRIASSQNNFYTEEGYFLVLTKPYEEYLDEPEGGVEPAVSEKENTMSRKANYYPSQQMQVSGSSALSSGIMAQPPPPQWIGANFYPFFPGSPATSNNGYPYNPRQQSPPPSVIIQPMPPQWIGPIYPWTWLPDHAYQYGFDNVIVPFTNSYWNYVPYTTFYFNTDPIIW